MAHYLEHMLFLGTEKYPSDGDYDAYLNKNAGDFYLAQPMPTLLTS